MIYRKIRVLAITIFLLILVISTFPKLSTKTEITLSMANTSEIPSDYSFIGFYVNSSSAYSNGAFHLFDYGSFGNSLIPFTDLTNLSLFSLIIIPMKYNWTAVEITSLTNFISTGGIAIVTASIPSILLNITTASLETFWILPTSLIAQSISDTHHLALEVSYQKAYTTVSGTIYPHEVVRDLKYIKTINEPNIDILHNASNDSKGTQFIGYSTILKKIGAGSLVFSTIPFFDLLGQSAAGGPTLPSSTRGWLSRGPTSVMLNSFVTQVFLLNENFIPLRWHTPFGKISLVSSRDDVDGYYPSVVQNRGTVDQVHGIPTIFYELRDNIPPDHWNTVLNSSPEFPQGYHYPGYHRHTAYEASPESYLARIIDIENETGRQVYFECHHGAGSGFYGQNYVRSAIEATNDLDHFVIYTSGEGGHQNDYLEPFLYRLANGTVTRAKNYFTFPKINTLDSMISSNDVTRFEDLVTKAVFQHRYLRQAHWLLHSQNVQSYLLTRYNDFLKNVIDPIYDYLYSDPYTFAKLNMAYTENVSVGYKSNSSLLDIILQTTQDLEGYTFNIPYNNSIYLSKIEVDGTAIDLNDIQIIPNGKSKLLLFYVNVTQGSHNILVTFQDTFTSLPVDQDNDGLCDNWELAYFSTDPTLYDSDGDTMSDGDEIFIYNTDPKMISSTTTSLPTYPTSTSLPPLNTTYSTDDLKTTTNSLIITNNSGNISTTPNRSAIDIGSLLGGMLIYVVVQIRRRKKQ